MIYQMDSKFIRTKLGFSVKEDLALEDLKLAISKYQDRYTNYPTLIITTLLLKAKINELVHKELKRKQCPVSEEIPDYKIYGADIISAPSIPDNLMCFF